jgi:fungal STAND N-terminal Goodbye domain
MMAANSGFDSLWSQAVQSYISSTGRTDAENSILGNIHSPDDLLVVIGRDNDKFSGFREKRSKLYNVLKVALGPVSIASSLAKEAIASSPFAPASVILGAVALLIKSASGVSQVYDCIEKLFSKLSGFTQRLEEYVQTDINYHLRRNLIFVLTCLLHILGRSECVIKEGRWRKFGKVFALGEDAKVKELFSELEKLLDNEQRLVGAISYRICTDVDIKIDEVMNTTRATLEMAKQSESQRRSGDLAALIEKHLITPAYHKNAAIYHEYNDATLKSSGEWLMAEAKFQDWLDRKSRFLFVRGGPGTGKSYLSAITIGRIKSTYSQNAIHTDGVSVAFFYIKEHDQDLQDLGNVLKSICCQIAQVDSVFRNHLDSVLNQPETTVTPRRIWNNVLLSFFGRTGLSNSAMIVLDGLDEAPPQALRDLFALIEDISKTGDLVPRLSIALFARPEVSEYFRSRFVKILSQVDIGEKNEVDIASYIKERVTQIMVVWQTMQLKNQKAAAKLAREIRSRVLAKADGMFFKVVLIMDQLYDKERISSVYASIEASPPKLEAMIARVFERLIVNQNVDKEDLRELLLWVCVAKRPLSMAELNAILKQRTGKPYDALEARLKGSFASIFKLSGEDTSVRSGSDDVVDLEMKLSGSVVRSRTFKFDIDNIPSDGDEDVDDGQETKGVRCGTGPDDHSVFEKEHFNEEALNRFWNTGVRFSHSSIRDFLVKSDEKDGNTLAAKLGLAIDLNAAEVHVAALSIQRILLGLPEMEHSLDCDYLTYAGLFFSDHLISIDVNQVPDEKCQSMIQQICKMFSNEDALRTTIKVLSRCSNKMLHCFFETPTFSTVIRAQWLVRARTDFFTTEEWRWIQASISSRAEYFRPFTIQCARMWLNKTGYDDADYMKERYQMYLSWIIHCFLKIVSASHAGCLRLL